MPETPLVSIILPTFNRAHLLPRAVNSVLHQSYANWELLIWNDGSTDNTEAVLNSYTDIRIHYFADINKGYAHSINQLILQTRGKYLAFLDDDDEWMPSKLEKQISILHRHPDVDLIFADYRNIDFSKKIENLGFLQNAAGLKKLKCEKLDHVHIIKGGILEGIGTDNFIATDSMIFHRRILDKLSGFNTHLVNAQDFEFWWRAGLAGYRFAYTDKILLIRNKYPGGLSTSSVQTLTGTLHTLNACAEASRRAGREETIQFLRPTYRNLWQNLITAYGLKVTYPWRSRLLPKPITMVFSWAALAHYLGLSTPRSKGKKSEPARFAHFRAKLPLALHRACNPVALLLQ
jgi:glycosyltransferase involved in cell wall biosynthesis